MEASPLGEKSREEAPAPGLRVLVVDDDRNVRATLAVCLEDAGCEAQLVASPQSALEAVAARPFELAFVDLRLGQASGLDLIPQLLAESPGIAVVMITAYATVDTAVQAVKQGAYDYVPKPFTPEEIRLVVRRVAAERATRSRLAALEQDLREATPEVELESDAPAVRAALATLERAAASEAPVLLTGESGTGKGVFARALHARSSRHAGPFVIVNCPTLSAELLASELFGHARGAFTGAVQDQPGRVEAAAGGTLFLDEIAEIAPALQAKLLRFAQDRSFERVGESRTRHADVRLVAATNRDLALEVREGRFREDLFYRLNVLEIRIPPLRERPQDVLRLARRFLEHFARAAKRRPLTLSSEAEQALLAHSWPGNVRELRNAMERCTILGSGERLDVASLPFAPRAAADGAPRAGDEIDLETLEREHIRRILESTPRLEEAARKLGIDDSTLWRKRKRYGL
jgi:NtrC-family two-component system response regulator AlgB